MMGYTYRKLKDEVDDQIKSFNEFYGNEMSFKMHSKLSFKHYVLSKIKKGDRVKIDFKNYEYKVITFKLLR